MAVFSSQVGGENDPVATLIRLTPAGEEYKNVSVSYLFKQIFKVPGFFDPSNL